MLLIISFISFYKMNTIETFTVVNSNKVITKLITHRKSQDGIETT